MADKRTVAASVAVSLEFLEVNFVKGYFEFAPFLSAGMKFLARLRFRPTSAIPALVVFLTFNS